MLRLSLALLVTCAACGDGGPSGEDLSVWDGALPDLSGDMAVIGCTTSATCPEGQPVCTNQQCAPCAGPAPSAECAAHHGPQRVLCSAAGLEKSDGAALLTGGRTPAVTWVASVIRTEPRVRSVRLCHFGGPRHTVCFPLRE
jgi:hypothetical protein